MYEDIPTFLFLSLSGFMRGVFLVLRWYFSSPKRRHPGSKFDGGQEDKEQRKFFDLVAITFQKAIPPLDGDTFYAATNLIFEEYRVQKLLLFTNSFLCVRARACFQDLPFVIPYCPPRQSDETQIVQDADFALCTSNCRVQSRSDAPPVDCHPLGPARLLRFCFALFQAPSWTSFMFFLKAGIIMVYNHQDL